MEINFKFMAFPLFLLVSILCIFISSIYVTFTENYFKFFLKVRKVHN